MIAHVRPRSLEHFTPLCNVAASIDNLDLNVNTTSGIDAAGPISAQSGMVTRRTSHATDRSARTSALIGLTIYALTHDQPLWLPAIQRIMSREGLSHA
jgi:hypothetical protein